jgi:hypothetical protein
MKANDVGDTGNMADKAGVVIAVVDLGCIAFELHGVHGV